MTASALYRGVVTHRRLRPFEHVLRYRSFQILLDLDEAPALSRRLKLFGFNRPALLSFYERDHGDGSSTPLKAQVEARVRADGHAVGGPVRVLCLPRVLGFVFNPISVYFCHDEDGRPSAILYEVNSTFGDRISYVAPASASHQIAKAMHVSPFMDMNHDYAFRILPPGETLALSIDLKRGQDRWLTAKFAGSRAAFDDASLLRAWLADPVATLKVVAAIHWEAAKLWVKGARYRPRPHPRLRAFASGCPVAHAAGADRRGAAAPPV